MACFDAVTLSRHRRHNLMQSALVLAGIAGWMALVGWLVAGTVGIVLAIVGSAVALMVQPMRSIPSLKLWYGAQVVLPQAAPDLHSLMRSLAERAGLEHVPTLLYIPRRDLIALSSGWGGDSAVALSDGILRTLPPRELAAVLAHEISHLRAGDLKLLSLAEAAGRLTRTMSLVGLFFMIFYLPDALAMGAGLPLLPWLLLMVAPLVSDLLTLKLSRTREFAADAGAVELTGDPQPLMAALTRIEAMQAGRGWDHSSRSARGWLALIRTHPTTQDRLARLRELAPVGPIWEMPAGPLWPFPVFTRTRSIPGAWRFHPHYRLR